MIKIKNNYFLVLNQISILLLLCLSIFSPTTTTFADGLVLNGNEQQVFLKGNYIELYEDSTGKLPIHYIVSNDGQTIVFIPSNKRFGFIIKKSTSAYWFKVKLKNNSTQSEHYSLESFNYRIDSLHFYEIKKGQLFSADSLGVAYKFVKRKIKHKNLVHDFWIAPGEELILYAKIKNRYETPVEFVIRKIDFFTSYAVSEYFYLGLFYGSILIIILLNILAGAFLKSRSHFFYVFYIFFVGTFFLSQDGLGFQYIWPMANYMNDYAYMFSIYFMTVFLLLYTNAFLNLKIYYPKYSKIFYYFIAFRSIVLIINLCFFPKIRHILYVDLVPFFLTYYCSYLSFKSNYPLSKYFLIGSTILVVGFVVNFLMLFSLIIKNIYTFYCVNICFLLEMIVFYFALAERIRFYKQHKAISIELKKEIADKEQLIEQFTYKTSHDLSGPVKTIIGVANLSLATINSDEQRAYMQMIQTTALRLDEVLKSVAEINIIRAHDLEKTLIDVPILMENILSNEKLNKYSDTIKVTIINNHPGTLREDSYILYTLLFNLLIFQITCLKYKDERVINVSITITKDACTISSSNNGEAIPEEHHKNIFKIFFRLSNDNNDLGTYMYIMKLCADKLNAKTIIGNTESSTSFRIIIPL